MTTLERAMVGGVEERDGAWRPIFQVHAPCHGGEHKGCRIESEHVGPACRDIDHAIDTLIATRDDLGLEGWEGPPAKS